MSPEEDRTRDTVDSEPKHYQLSYSGPRSHVNPKGTVPSAGGSEEGRTCSGGRDCLFVGCLASQQHAVVSQGRICSDNFTCCHTEMEAADQTFYLTQSQYTDTGPTSPGADPITPGRLAG